MGIWQLSIPPDGLGCFHLPCICEIAVSTWSAVSGEL